jgi:hypothetical protein
MSSAVPLIVWESPDLTLTSPAALLRSRTSPAAESVWAVAGELRMMTDASAWAFESEMRKMPPCEAVTV